MTFEYLQGETVSPWACQIPKTHASLFSQQDIHPVQKKSLSHPLVAWIGTPLVMGGDLRAKTLL
jgi:hypothetical protein